MGTPADVADMMQDWFESGGCDGWNMMPAFLPDPAIEAFEWLVPELQRRGLFQTEYQGDGTLRGSLGLPRPRFAAAGGRSSPSQASPIDAPATMKTPGT